MEHCAVILVFSDVADAHLSVRCTSSVRQRPSIPENLRVVRNVLSIQTTSSRTIRTFFVCSTCLNPFVTIVHSSCCNTAECTSDCNNSSTIDCGNTHIFQRTLIHKHHARNDTGSGGKSQRSITNQCSRSHRDDQESHRFGEVTMRGRFCTRLTRLRSHCKHRSSSVREATQDLRCKRTSIQLSGIASVGIEHTSLKTHFLSFSALAH